MLIIKNRSGVYFLKNDLGITINNAVKPNILSISFCFHKNVINTVHSCCVFVCFVEKIMFDVPREKGQSNRKIKQTKGFIKIYED